MGKTIVDKKDLADTPYLVPGAARHTKRTRSDPIHTRKTTVLQRFKINRPEVSREARGMQRDVYREMPRDTDYETLKAAGEPCDMELHTTTTMADLHKQAAFVRKRMQQGEGKPSQIIFKYAQIRKKHAVFALVQESLKYYKLINQVLQDVNFFRDKSLLEYTDLVHVLIYDMLFGQGIDFAWPNPALHAIHLHRAKIMHALNIWASNDPASLVPFKDLPRYARINIIKTNIDLMISSFRSRGYFFKDNLTPDQYPHMGPKEFGRDPDIKNLLVFSPGTNLSGPEQTRYDVIPQDKASCFSALALLDKNNRVKPRGVLDACAAPGNKTLHLAALLGQRKKITESGEMYTDPGDVPLTAVEQNEERFGELTKRVFNAWARVNCINADFLSLRPFRFPNVTHILVDPSCSGSGMVSPFGFSLEEQKQKVVTLRSPAVKSEFIELPEDYSDGEYFECGSDSDDDEDDGSDLSDSDSDSDSEEDEKDEKDEDEKDGDKNKEGEGKNDSKDDGSESSDDSSSDDSEDEKKDKNKSDGKSSKEVKGAAKIDESKGDSESDDDDYVAPSRNNKKRKQPEEEEHRTDFENYSVRVLNDESLVKRIDGLRKFQISAIKHALKFPAVERVVYSTCSVYIEENEQVVEEILNQYPDFRLVKALPSWKTRGLKTFEGGHLCARAFPEGNAATGFFVACFERKVPLPVPENTVDQSNTGKHNSFNKNNNNYNNYNNNNNNKFNNNYNNNKNYNNNYNNNKNYHNNYNKDNYKDNSNNTDNNYNDNKNSNFHKKGFQNDFNKQSTPTTQSKATHTKFTTPSSEPPATTTTSTAKQEKLEKKKIEKKEKRKAKKKEKKQNKQTDATTTESKKVATPAQGPSKKKRKPNPTPIVK